MQTSWWLDWAASGLIWARLTVANDGSAEVLDCDGKYHRFADEQAARLWLNEDEYSLLQHMIEDGAVPESTVPPQALTDQELVPLMMSGKRVR
jgi:hypothetical protein